MIDLAHPRQPASRQSHSRAMGNRRSRRLLLAILAAVLGTLSSGMASTLPATALSGRVHGVATIRDRGATNDAVVYLVPAAATDPAPEVVAPADRVYRMDQRSLQFAPHVLVVPVGATVEFSNSDDVLHNIFAPPLEREGFDLGTWPRSESRRHTFDQPGVNVLLCNVHPDMEAFIVVAPTAYYALTLEDGSFTIDGVPPGRYTLFAWHERCVPHEMQIEVSDGTNEVPLLLSLVSRR